MERFRLRRTGPEKRTQFAAVLMVALAFGLTGAEQVWSQEEISDPQISDAIYDRLMLDQAVPVADVDVETNAGIVTLEGTVDNLLAKRRAARIAETIRGVRSVVNLIEVDLLIERADSEVEWSVARALDEDPATERFDIEVAVEDAVVHLRGEVDSQQAKELAEKVAAGVRGVQDVENNLRFRHTPDRTDAQIKAEVQRTLRWDTLVDHALINVRAEAGEVVLDGVVGSAAEKSRAESRAWVEGVVSVDSGELEVERWARDEDLREDKYAPQPDEDIQEAINDALYYHPRVSMFDITPEVSEGRVTLRGTVSSVAAKHSAAQVARNTVGVETVVNRIRVRPDERPADEHIEEKVRDALERSPHVRRLDVEVAVANGVVHLRGTVDTSLEKRRAGALAQRPEGVVSVRNNLEVGDNDALRPYRYDPHLDDYDPQYPERAIPPRRPLRTDREIERGIEHRMHWSPYVDREDLEISVDRGVAVLEGQVESHRERRVAVQKAYEGGAVWVHDRIMVE